MVMVDPVTLLFTSSLPGAYMRDYAVLRNDLQDDLQIRDVMLTSDMTLEAARSLWLSKSFFKKLQDEIDPLADSRCLAIFNHSNARCREFALRPDSTFDELVIGEVKASFDNMFFRGPEHTFSFSDIAANFDVGPGASADVQSYNFYTKLFDSTLSSTDERLYRMYRSAISLLPGWLSAENAREAIHGHRIVGGNRLSFVPKTSVISRSICVEPVLNMYFQKGLGSVFQSLLKKKFRIDLSSQPELNRSMALSGSVDGRFSTIDLSSASDSISLLLLKEILPSYVYDWMMLMRSPTTIFPDGTEVELAMVSTMGNAFTFPLQTLLFSVIVTSCYRVLGIKPTYTRHGPSNFAVFGDDIIVRQDSYNFVVHCLSLFGFVVNEDKSFNCGDFRESCGGDYWRGHDIRGVYIQSLKTRADIYSALNRLVRWSAKCGILIPRVIARLRSWVKFLPIPYSDGDSEGIKVPHPPSILKRNRNTGGINYTAYVKTVTKLKVPYLPSLQFVYRKRSGIKNPALYNADGLLIAFVGGYIRDSAINLRDEIDSFKLKRRTTSRWRGAVNTFATKRIETWTRNDGTSTRLHSGILAIKSSFDPVFLRTKLADSNSQRDEWEFIAELYFD